MCIFEEKIKGRIPNLKKKTKLVLKAESLSGQPEKLQVAIVDDKGYSYGKVVEIKPGISEYSIDFSALKSVKTVTLPRPYPSFLSYYFKHRENGSFDISSAEAVQFSIGPGIEKENFQKPHKLGLISLSLQ